jgi:hypothetical protein
MSSEPFATAVPDQPDPADGQDAWMAAAFAALPATDFFDPAVLEAVDLLMQDSESVTAEARQRLVEGANRGVRWRRRLDDRLGKLLLDRRCALRLSPGAVAAHIGVAASLIAEVEAGARPVQSITAEKVAAWIQHVKLTPGVALAALQEASGPGKSARSSEDSPASQFGAAVAAALGWSHGRC